MRVDQAKRLKELEAENARLKRAVADLTVDKQVHQVSAWPACLIRKSCGFPCSPRIFRIEFRSC
jgi:hypothetical protein